MFSGFSWAQKGKPAYRLFDSNGKPVSYEKMMKKAKAADVVFLGEFHNNPISHWMELEISMDLFKQHGKNLVLGAEMFERDQQEGLDKWMLLSGDEADTAMKNLKPWPNYKTDYKPVLDFAKENGLVFVGTNVPRRYASKVSKEGVGYLDTLPDSDKRFLCPLPLVVDFDLSMYKVMAEMFGGHGHGAAPEKMISAQALKDATMAWYITKNMNENQHFFHMNGAFHSERSEGIVYYLKKYKPEVKTITITTKEYDDISKIESKDKGTGDFILAIPASMTKTY